MGPKKRDASGLGVYNMECCTGDFCNNGTFPYLPPLPAEVPDKNDSNNTLLIVSAVIAGIFFIGITAIVVVQCKRMNHKKRLVDARIQQDADTYYASDDLLKRTHACGDSTLRVSAKYLS